jgi:hypothetical protein
MKKPRNSGAFSFSSCLFFLSLSYITCYSENGCTRISVGGNCDRATYLLWVGLQSEFYRNYALLSGKYGLTWPVMYTGSAAGSHL